MARWLSIACAFALGCGDDAMQPPVDAPPGVDAPRADAAVDAAPIGDAPMVDAPAIDAPAIDAAMPDAACVPASAEDCFNGIDDDCNGSADCADPACNPIAECVLDATGFALGVHVPLGTSCPPGYGGGGPSLAQGLSSGGTCSGCSCSGIAVCGTRVRELSAGTCPGTEVLNLIVWSFQCQSLPFTTTNVHVDPIQLQSTCGYSGTPTVPPTSWSTERQFCQASDIGAGCAMGSVCLRQVTQHCALQAGTTSCSSNYTPESGGTWYTSVDDQRTCGASCTCAHAGGDCGTSFVRGFTGASNCSGANVNLTSGDNCALPAPPTSARVILQGETPPTCTPSNQLTGTATPQGPQTLCCL